MNFAQISSTKLAYVDRGAGNVVLLIHGFPLDHTMWDAQIEALARRHRVIAPDLRGFGESPLGTIDESQGVPMERYAADLAELLDGLAIDEPVVPVGFSMGGYVAWQFVAHYPQRLRALVQCDTRAVADNDEGRAGRIKMAENVAEWGSARVADIMGPKLFAPATFKERPELVAAVRTVVARTPPAAIAAAQRGMAARPDVSLSLPRITVPALVLCGELDAISPPAEMKKIADAIPGGQFVEIPSAGHMTTMEKPQDVSDALLQFLTHLPNGR